MKMLGAPKLVFGVPFIDDRPLLSSIKNIPLEHHDYAPSPGTVSPSYLEVMKKEGQIGRNDFSWRYYIHIPIYNQQKSKISDSIAKNVYAKLCFFDLEGNPIGKGREFDGRWETSQQPSASENLEKLRFIDILPEDKQNLDIATQGIRGGYWYVMNNDSYKNNEYPDNKLKEDGFIFRLHLNGSNFFMKSVCYKFVSIGQRGKPEFVKIEQG